MADEFGGFMKRSFVNGKSTYENGASYETLLVPEGTSNVSRDVLYTIQAGDYITISNWLNATMLVAERKPNSVIVIEPTAGSNGSTPFRWREYTFDQLASRMISNGGGMLRHHEFNNLQ